VEGFGRGDVSTAHEHGFPQTSLPMELECVACLFDLMKRGRRRSRRTMHYTVVVALLLRGTDTDTDDGRFWRAWMGMGMRWCGVKKMHIVLRWLVEMRAHQAGGREVKKERLGIGRGD